jgi:hypothetical protein
MERHSEFKDFCKYLALSLSLLAAVLNWAGDAPTLVADIAILVALLAFVQS